MKIFLSTDNLMTRAQLEDTWRNARAKVFSKSTETKPDLIVIDLTNDAALSEIQTLRASYPNTEILVFGPHVDGEAFRHARESGATSQVARGKVVARILKRLQG